MRNRKLVLSLLLILCVFLLGAFFFKDFFATRTSGDRQNITNLESAYNADTEIFQALDKLRISQEKATVIAHGNNGQRIVALTFDGLTDRTVVQQILDLLKKYNAKATFFVDGVQVAQDPQTVTNIKNAGQRIENYSFSGIPKMETLPVEKLVNDFCRAQKIIKINTDKQPTLLKCNDTKYTDQLLQAAKASGFASVVKSDAFLNVKKTTSLEAAESFVKGIKPGNIVSVKLKSNADLIVNEPGKTDLRPAIDKKPGLKELSTQVDGDKEMVEAVERLLLALDKAKYTTVYLEDISKPVVAVNDTKTGIFQPAGLLSFLQEQVVSLFTCRTAYAAEEHREQEIKTIFTTEPALSFTFGGLSNQETVDDVLSRLHGLGIKATFFVMETEMRKYPETVRRIINNGHEIGIAVRPKDGETAEEIGKSIVRCRTLLQEQFGVTTNLVKQPWGTVTDALKEAAAALQCKLIGQTVNVVQSKHKDYTSADQVMSEIFGKAVVSLGRGQIVHFRMDYYTNSHLIGELIEKIKQSKVDNIAYATSYDNPAHNPANDSQYIIKPVGKILGNTQFLYQIPADLERIPLNLRRVGARPDYDKRNFLDEISKRYIGNPDVDDDDRIIGFSKMETRRLDKSGLIHTGDNVIFLGFDDWGSDASINKLLYVLRKHNVPGTFYIITGNVMYNPNLLRTIALQGHEIGSHSDKHQAMAVRDPVTNKQYRTQNKEEYTQDLRLAYQKLRDIVGDVSVNGRPALTRFFRPPTLAISKMGLETLLETGYEYIVGGSYSTEDYDAKNPTQLVKRLKEGIYKLNGDVIKGTVLVMHMSDSAAYTAMAVDILLTANEAKADSDPSKFKVGRLSDYLKDGYAQMRRDVGP